MKRSNKPLNRKESGSARGLIGTLIVIALILIIPLFFAIKTRATRQGVQSTSVSSINPTENAPQNSAAVKPNQPPQCIYPLAQSIQGKRVSERYEFSDPKVVFTAGENESTISIIEWLPDNQRVLITQEFRGNSQQDIELFNPQTGERQIYATRQRIDTRPKWLPGLDEVIYPAMKIIKEDKTNHRIEFTRQVLSSSGNPKSASVVADNLPGFSIALNPNNGQTAYLSDKQLAKRNASLGVLPSVPFDLSAWDYRNIGTRSPLSFEMAWRPDSSQIFLYSDGKGGIGYTFLLDAQTGELCEINFKGWAGVGRWSSDGRYLAITRSTKAVPIDSSDLAVLDTATGNVYSMPLPSQGFSGRHYVGDLVWAPDNVHLVAIGYVLPFAPTGHLHDKDIFSGLFLADFASGRSAQVLSKYQFLAGWPGTNLAMSPDGSKLLVGCPANDILRLCLIDIKRMGGQ